MADEETKRPGYVQASGPDGETIWIPVAGDDPSPAISAEEQAEARRFAEQNREAIQQRSREREREITRGNVREAIGQSAGGAAVTNNESARRDILDNSARANEQIDDLVTALRDGADKMRLTDSEGRQWVMANDLRNNESGWVLQSKIDAQPQSFQIASESAESSGQFLKNRLAELGSTARQQLAESLSPAEVALLNWGNTATAGLLLEASGNEAARERLRLASEASPTAAFIGGLGGEITGLASYGGLAGGAAKLLGATRVGGRVVGLGKSLRNAATASAGNSMMRGTALRAAQSVGALGSLTAGAALGEVQAANAEAVLNDAELSAAQMIEAAKTGAVWGLGFGVGGAAMAGVWKVGRKTAQRLTDNPAKETVNASMKAREAAPEVVEETFADLERRAGGGTGRGGTRSFEKYNAWLDENEAAIRQGEGGDADFELLKGSAETNKAVFKAGNHKAIEETTAALEAVEESLKGLDMPPPSTKGPGAVASWTKRDVPTRTGRKGQQVPDAAKLGGDISKEAGAPYASAAGEGRAAFRRYANEVYVQTRALMDEVGLFLEGSPSEFLKKGPGAKLAKQVQKAAKRGPGVLNAKYAEEQLSPLEGDLVGKLAARKSNVGEAWQSFDRVGEGLQKIVNHPGVDATTKAEAQALIKRLTDKQLGAEGVESVFGSAGRHQADLQGAMNKVQGARQKLFGTGGESGERAAGALSKGGKLKRTDANAVLKDPGATDSLETINADLLEYRRALHEVAEVSTDGGGKAFQDALKKLDQRLEKFEPAMRARAALQRARTKVYGKPKGKSDTVDMPTSEVNAAAAGKSAEPTQPSLFNREFFGRTIGEWAIEWTPAPVRVAHKLYKHFSAKPKIEAAVMTTREQWQARLQTALEGAKGAFDATSPAMRGILAAKAGRTVGGGYQIELERTPAKVKAETFERLRADITGLMESPDYMVGRAAQATQGVMDASPALAERMQMQMAQALFYLAQELPEGNVDMLNPGKAPQVSNGQIHSFLMKHRAVDNPLVMIEDLGRGVLRTETADAVQTVYPTLFAEMALGVADLMYGKDVPFATRVQVGLMLGVSGTPLMTPSSILASQTAYGSAQTPEAAQVAGMRQRGLAQTSLMSRGAQRMPAASRSSAGRYMTISDSLNQEG